MNARELSVLLLVVAIGGCSSQPGAYGPHLLPRPVDPYMGCPTSDVLDLVYDGKSYGADAADSAAWPAGIVKAIESCAPGWNILECKPNQRCGSLPATQVTIAREGVVRIVFVDELGRCLSCTGNEPKDRRVHSLVQQLQPGRIRQWLEFTVLGDPKEILGYKAFVENHGKTYCVEVIFDPQKAQFVPGPVTRVLAARVFMPKNIGP